jgi:hypothetical protein
LKISIFLLQMAAIIAVKQARENLVVSISAAIGKMNEIRATTHAQKKAIENLEMLQTELSEKSEFYGIDDVNRAAICFKNCVNEFVTVGYGVVTADMIIDSYIGRLNSPAIRTVRDTGVHQVFTFDIMGRRFFGAQNGPTHIRSAYYLICKPVLIEELAMIATGKYVYISPDPVDY